MLSFPIISSLILSLYLTLLAGSPISPRESFSSRRSLELVRREEHIVISGNTRVYVRFQIPQGSQTWKDARVTSTNWQSNVDSVTSTCEDFFNSNGRNDQLWRSFDQATLQYAGIFQFACMRGMVPQSGLNGDNVAVSFILPSGVAKLQSYGPDTSGENWTPTDREAVTGIFGINGQLDESDYAYTTVKGIKDSLADWWPRRNYDPDMRMSLQKANGDYVFLSMGLVN